MSTQSSNIKELFQDNYFIIPEYQRGYDWDTKQVNDLLNDITYMMESGLDEHYFGTIVLSQKAKSKYKYAIVDGQQRITTIVLLMDTIWKELKEISSEYDGDDGDFEFNIRKLREEIKNRYRSDTDMNNYYVLKPDEDLEPIYKKVLDNTEQVNKEMCSRRSELNFVKNQNQIQEKLSKKKNKCKEHSESWEKDYYNYLKDIKDVLEKEFKITKYEVGNYSQAGRMFSIVNDRGKSISISDKVKSQLVYKSSKINEEELVKYVHESFNKIDKRVIGRDGEKSDLDSFIENHWKIFTGFTSFDSNDKELHRRLSDEYLNSNDEEAIHKFIKKYMDNLLEYSKQYKYVNEPLKHTDELSKELYYLSDNQDYHPLIYALFKNTVDVKKRNEVIKNLYKLSFIHNRVCRSQKFVQISVNHAFELEWCKMSQEYIETFKNSDNQHNKKSNEIPSITKGKKYDEIQNIIKEKLNTNNDNVRKKLRHYLESNNVNNSNITNWSGLSKKMRKLLLFEYLSSKDDELTIEEFDNEDYDEEHIWPKSTEKNNYIWNLGNLTLLEPQINRQIQGDSFEIKKGQYDKSKIQPNKKLSTYKDWSKDKIENRREEMIEYFENQFFIDD